MQVRKGLACWGSPVPRRFQPQTLGACVVLLRNPSWVGARMPSELFTENFPEGVRRVLNDKCSKPQEVQPPSLNSPKLGKSVFFQQQAPGPGRPRPAAREQQAISTGQSGTFSIGVGEGLAPGRPPGPSLNLQMPRLHPGSSHSNWEHEGSADHREICRPPGSPT